MSRQNNIRRIFKLILKDYSRGKFKNHSQFAKHMETWGFYNCHYWTVTQFLKTDIKSKLVNRIRKAALKRGKLVDLYDFILVWKLKKGKLTEWFGEQVYQNYHLIPFIETYEEEVIYVRSGYKKGGVIIWNTTKEKIKG